MNRLALSFLLLPALVLGGEIPEASLVLETLGPSLGAEVREAAPPTFVLLKDGQVFLGGTGRVWTGRLEKGEANNLLKKATKVRKLPGVADAVQFGGGAAAFRLVILDGHRQEILVKGDPAQAPQNLLPLASLLQDLLSFDHPSLKPFSPASYLLRVREGHLDGGCRSWGFSTSLAESLASPHVLPAASISGWPTGASPASVCSGDKSFIVTLRPLLPGERF